MYFTREMDDQRKSLDQRVDQTQKVLKYNLPKWQHAFHEERIATRTLMG